MTKDKKHRGRPNPQPWVPPQDGILGGIDPQVKEMVFSSQQRVQQLQLQIGALEMQKARLLHQAQEINTEAQKAIDQEASRLGIPPGVPWQMGADGVARLASPPGIPQQGPPPTPQAPPGPRPVVNLAEVPKDEDPPVDKTAEEEPPSPEGEENG